MAATGPVVGGAGCGVGNDIPAGSELPTNGRGRCWIDRTRTRLALYPGRYEPPNDGSQQAEVPGELRSGLL